MRLVLCLERSLTRWNMKGYAGGLGASAFDCLHIGLVGFWPDDLGVSFTVCGSRYFGNLAHDCKLTWCESIKQMCEGSTSRGRVAAFQLESLILAQNERWRQA